MSKRVLIGLDIGTSGAKCIAVDEDGGLVVRYLEGEKTGTEETLRTGEISISID